MENASITTGPSPSSPPLSPRATAIARGLCRTGRITELRGKPVGLEVDDRWVTLPDGTGRFYFVAIDGSELRRGEDVATADELQTGFVDAMARIGGKIAEAGGRS